MCVIVCVRACDVILCNAANLLLTVCLQLLNTLLSNRDERFLQTAGLVALVRLPPLFPLLIVNYCLGFTKVRYRAYLAGTAVGIAPTVFAEVYMGSLLEAIAELQGGQSMVFLLVAVLVTAAVTVAVTVIARRQLHKMRARVELSPAGDSADSLREPSHTSTTL
eukprot:m.128800 g.128800  ORF g.128800 m.128800 type:complete len:164 (+) comp14740_c0_seq11:47-538(+)